MKPTREKWRNAAMLALGAVVAAAALVVLDFPGADLVRDVDASRGLLYAAAWKLSEGLPATADVAMAKAYAGEACLTVARRGHQIFGAIGYCEEHPLHLLHKRILAASLDCGDTAAHLETVAQAIGLGRA